MTKFLKDYNRSVAPKIAQEVQWFLKQYGITYFSYQRFHEDGRHLSIFSSLEWSDFYLEKLNEDSPAFIEIAQNLDPYEFNPRLWPTKCSDPVVNALHQYNLWNGICFYKKCPEGCEAWEFAADRESTHLLNFYLENKPLLIQFISYIKPRIQKYLYPEDEKIYAHFSNTDSPNQSIWQEAATPIYCIGKQGPVQFSLQESRCIRELKHGHSAKDVADTLGLKQKTVEEYLSNARKKLGVHKNIQILSLLNGSLT